MDDARKIRPDDLRKLLPSQSVRYDPNQWKYVRTMVYRENKRRRKLGLLAELSIENNKVTCCTVDGAYYINAPYANEQLWAVVEEYSKRGASVVVTIDSRYQKLDVFKWGTLS